MRIMGLVFTGMLAVCVADSAFAAAAYTKDCKGTHQSLEGGVCTNQKSENPNRVVQERSSDFYRSTRHKHKKPETSNNSEK
jgi:hypothetical protein